jgi:hypothetical protein
MLTAAHNAGHDELVRGAIVLIRHMINVGGHRVWSTQSVRPSQPT